LEFYTPPVTLIKSQDAGYGHIFSGELRMKKTTLPKNGAKSRNTQNLEVDAEAVRAVRTVGNQEAFYFYEGIGKPTGEIARSLSDFLDKVKIVKSESLVFHLERKDFQNWVERTIGDKKLAEKLGRISSSKHDSVRTRICNTVENRIKELEKSPLTISIADNTTIVPVRV
jgi:predicted lactoylglutathione lyase